MFKAFKYRIYPTDSQIVLLNKHIGAVRFVYNLALETKCMAWAGNRVNLNCFDLIKQIPDLRKECIWLKEINSQSLQSPIRNLDNAFTLFFKGRKKFPKFKKKLNTGSFAVPQNAKVLNDKLFIPKFKGGIDIVLHRPFYGKIKNVTISRTATNKFFASVLCETDEVLNKSYPVLENTSIGVDVGIKYFAVLSNGVKYDNPKHLLRHENKLKYINRKLSKHKGGKKLKKLSLIHEKIANKRKDFLHKLSNELVKNHDTICLEGLKISNMAKNHSLSKSIYDASWGVFINMVEYKAMWAGKNVIKIGVFDPSTKTCSFCGSINNNLSLKDRSWTCCNCGSLLDRDVNAAINIKNFALRNYLSEGRRLKNQKELPTLVGVLTSEA